MSLLFVVYTPNHLGTCESSDSVYDAWDTAASGMFVAKVPAAAVLIDGPARTTENRSIYPHASKVAGDGLYRALAVLSSVPRSSPTTRIVVVCSAAGLFVHTGLWDWLNQALPNDRPTILGPGEGHQLYGTFLAMRTETAALFTKDTQAGVPPVGDLWLEAVAKRHSIAWVLWGSRSRILPPLVSTETGYDTRLLNSHIHYVDRLPDGSCVACRQVGQVMRGERRQPDVTDMTSPEVVQW